ncbi:PilZ domain-containing protein [Desulfonatronospira sp.]|uniref:PilZ domain-containing protein n=1 Tax=Desulfonatronospira sp. TaxID=1962951 RepID=UPI0025C3427F|nr:PilZ domain-containing protein [Desulfonatronospira sp.]
MSDLFGEFTFDYETNTRRKAYRVAIPGLFVHIKGRHQAFPVQDISASGVALKIETGQELEVETGQELELELLIRDKTFLEDLKARVIRHKDSMLACEFHNLDLHQEARLDKLVLEIQKKWILAEKKKRVEEN